MNYITPEQVLFIHYRIIEETGGSHGIRDLALLQSALARPMATFDKNVFIQIYSPKLLPLCILSSRVTLSWMVIKELQ